MLLKGFWEAESIGIKGDVLPNEKSIPEQEQFLNEIKHNGKRYSVTLTWIENIKEKLLSHYDLCVTRLYRLHQSLQKDEHLLNKYNSIINEQLQNGIVEKVNQKDAKQVSREALRPIYYMPHHAVVRNCDKATTKVRVVYDGSAHSPDSTISINICLKQRSNLIPLLFNITLCFRVHRIGLTADIQSAFLNICIDESDRDVLRFLWFENIHDDNLKLMICKFCRLVCGLRPSPAILGGTIWHHLRSYEISEPEVIERLRNDLYVDDLVSGADTEPGAIVLYGKSKEIMSEGGFNLRFNLRKWNSNSPEVCKAIENCEAQLSENLTDSKTNLQKAQNATTGFLEDDSSFVKSELNSFVLKLKLL